MIRSDAPHSIIIPEDGYTQDFLVGNNLAIRDNPEGFVQLGELTIKNTRVGSLLIIEAEGQTDITVAINEKKRILTTSTKTVLLVIDAAGTTIELK
mgnify:CR=1 FL=1